MIEAVDYEEFIENKLHRSECSGLDPLLMPDHAKPHQRALTSWALRKGRAAIFADTGLGKTWMFLEWARQVSEHGRVLILAPLAVAHQHVQEGSRWGVPIEYDGTGTSSALITVTNYDRMHKFNPRDFVGVVLDESSILKAFDGKLRNLIIESFADTMYRIACTATPAPNDFTELGNHAEFLGVKTRAEMLAEFFVHDGGRTSDWRLKGHAVEPFWRWVCSWAAFVKKPSDLGFSDEGYDLPELRIHEHVVETPHDASEILAASSTGTQGNLFAEDARTLADQRAVRRSTLDERVVLAAQLAAGDEPCIVWCELNAEADGVEKSIPGAVQVGGSDDADRKTERLLGFAQGKYRVLVTKPKIAGFGMNWQHCGKVILIGASHSYEQTYQAIRRCWRFGRTAPVDVHVIRADTEEAVIRNYERKEADALRMSEEMVKHMGDIQKDEINGSYREWNDYNPQEPMLWQGTDTGRKVLAQRHGQRFSVYHGDCVDALRGVPDASIGYSVFSPPFASLYTYSSSPRDMGNCTDHGTFYAQMGFLRDELMRTMMPGRLVSMHCMLLPTSKMRDGEIGLKDFRGELISLFERGGWIFHSEVVIWKDPVTAMQRTKALGLLYKQLKKDSCMSRQGIPDYVVTMRKPGKNPVPVEKKPEDFPVDLWQKYASPIWMDIDPSDTLQYRSARDHQDERHICPLQLEVIRRCVTLWSNPDDIVLSPFTGIGSEGYVSLQLNRRFVGAELKDSYYRQAIQNLKQAESGSQISMF